METDTLNERRKIHLEVDILEIDYRVRDPRTDIGPLDYDRDGNQIPWTEMSYAAALRQMEGRVKYRISFISNGQRLAVESPLVEPERAGRSLEHTLAHVGKSIYANWDKLQS